MGGDRGRVKPTRRWAAWVTVALALVGCGLLAIGSVLSWGSVWLWPIGLATVAVLLAGQRVLGPPLGGASDGIPNPDASGG